MKDYSLYKFSTINKNLIDALVKGYLYFSEPEKLNDPFDCRIDIRKAMNNAMKSAQEHHSQFGLQRLKLLIDHGHIFEQIEKDINTWGVCSFSKIIDLDKEPLMWSHYADDHRGVRILYEVPYNFLFENIDVNNILAVDSVNYDIDPLSKLFVNLANDEKEIDEKYVDRTVHEIIATILTSKNTCWDYEKEVRIIRKHSGSFEIPKSCIKQICFGLHTSDEDIVLIKEIVSNYELDVNLCKVVRTDSDFGIDYKEI